MPPPVRLHRSGSAPPPPAGSEAASRPARIARSGGDLFAGHHRARQQATARTILDPWRAPGEIRHRLSADEGGNDISDTGYAPGQETRPIDRRCSAPPRGVSESNLWAERHPWDATPSRAARKDLRRGIPARIRRRDNSATPKYGEIVFGGRIEHEPR